MIIYFEDDFLLEERARIPISDRGFLHGDGAYATIQVRDGTPLFLKTHLDNLREQCERFHLSMPLLERELIEELIRRNDALRGIWRLKVIVTGGDGGEYHLPKRHGRLIVFIQPFTPLPFKPLKMGIFSTPYFSCHAGYKSLAHLNRFYVMEEACRLGLDDGITLTEKGEILEASFGNLLWIQEKTLFTPNPSLPLYFGVTLRNCIHIAQELGFRIEYVTSRLAELPTLATIFRTNTMQGIRPIIQIGERIFTPNAAVQMLFIHGYEQLIEAEKKAAQYVPL